MLSYAFTATQAGVLVPRLKATNPRETLTEMLWNEYGDDLMQAILEAIAATTDAATYQEVVDAIANHDLAAALDAIPWDDVGSEKLSRVVPGLLRGALEDSGAAAATALTDSLGIGGVGLGFSITRDQLGDLIKQQSSTLIGYITDVQAQDIDLVIQNVLAGNITADSAADLILDGQLIGLTPRDVNAVFNSLNRDLGNGMGLSDADQRAVDYTQRLLRNRAESIATTEMTRAKSEGTMQMAHQAIEDGDMEMGAEKEWSADGDNPCDDCLEMDGETVDLFDSFSSGDDAPPGHVRCLPGDALVTAARGVSAQTERMFKGDLAILDTGSNRFHRPLACTANHPVLTPRGWVPASALRVGDDVVTHRLDAGPLLRDDKGEYAPTPIHEVGETLQRNGVVATAKVPVSAPDFHGDGKGSHVAVVRSYGLLRGHQEGRLRKRRLQRPFARVEAPRPLHSHCPRHQKLRTLRNAPHSGVGRRGSGHPGSGAHALVAFLLRGAVAAGSYAGRHKTLDERRTRDSSLARQGLRGLSSSVSVEKIGEIRNQRFEGHVYNLETRDGMYVAEGIVTHNCECNLVIHPGRSA